MRVVFLRDVDNVAEAGEVKEVKNGFARNYLVPQKLAIRATRETLKQIEAIKKIAATDRKKAFKGIEVLGQQIEGTVISLKARAGPTGRFYGSITGAAIADELTQLLGKTISRRLVNLESPIHTPGEYEVILRLGQGVSPTVKVVAEAEE